jgi:hypothetical protein
MKSRLSTLVSVLVLSTLIVGALTGCSGKEAQVIASSSGESITAFVNVNLVPMTGERVVENQTVLVEGTRIIAVGPTGEVAIPDNATVIDGEGTYLMPGLADMHMHTTPAWHTDEWPVSPLNLYLANGVTTVRNLDPLPDYVGEPPISPDYVLRWREDIRDGKLAGPTMYATGTSLQGPNDWRPSVTKVGDAERVVRENKEKGYDFVKIFDDLTEEQFEEAMATARETGMYTVGHIPYRLGLDGVLSGGMDEIAHVVPLLLWERVESKRTPDMTIHEYVQNLTEFLHQEWDGVDFETWQDRESETISDIVGKLESSNIRICTTAWGPDMTYQKVFEPESFLSRPGTKYSRRRFLDLFQRGEDGDQAFFAEHKDMVLPLIYERDLWLRELRAAGVFLVLGTDSGIGMGIVPGFSIHDELLTLTKNGFTPYEAIATGTVNASKVVEEMIGVDEFGTIEVGKRADLILVRGNPLEDVANIRNPLGVMAAGRWYSQEALEQMIAIEEEPSNSSKSE